MRRRSKTTALYESDFDDLKRSLEVAFNKVADNIPQPSITREDVLKLLVKDEHRALLEKAQDLCSGANHRNYSLGTKWPVYLPTDTPEFEAVHTPGANLLFRFPDEVNYLIPDYTKNGPLRHQAPELHDQVDTWLRKRAAVGYAYAKADATLSLLNKKLNSPMEVRYYCPGMLALMDYSERLRKLRERLRSVKVMTPSKKLPPGIVQECRNVTTLLGRAALLPDPPKRDNAVHLQASLEAIMITVFPPPYAVVQALW